MMARILRLPGDLPILEKYDFDMPLESYRQVPQTLLLTLMPSR